MSKSNSFVKILKNINRSINSLLEKNLNKLNINNLINIARSNKIFLTIVAAIILTLSYLSLPNIYKQAEISKKIKEDLFKNLNLEFNFTNEFNYKFLPRPHFISTESSILFNQTQIGEIKKIKIIISMENLFSLKNMKFKKIVLEETNFNLNKKNYNFFEKLLDNNFIDSRFKIINSNVFFRNVENEVLFINKIYNMEYFHDLNELQNILYSENEIFNLPYSIKIFKNQTEKKLYSKFNIELLKLQIENYHSYDQKIKSGSTEFLFNKLKSFANYKIKKNFFEFEIFEKQDNPKFSFNGKFNFKPFHSSIEGITDELKLSYLFSSNSIIVQLLKTEILNSKNLNFKLNVKADKIKDFNNFINIFLNFKIQEGLMDFDNTLFEWKNYANFELLNNLIYVKNSELILDGTLKIDITDYTGIYKFLLTPKNLRKKINHIDVNYTYNFDQKIISLKDIRIDDQFNQNVNKVINNISLESDQLQNKIYLKKLLNKAIKIYAG